MKRPIVLVIFAGTLAVIALAVGGVIGGAFVYTMLNRPAAAASEANRASAPNSALAPGAVQAPATDPGVVVVHVASDGVAAKAGLQRGDIITAVDGTAVNDMPEILKALDAHQAGDTVTLTISRGGASQDLRLTLPEARQNSPVRFDLGFQGFAGQVEFGWVGKSPLKFEGMVVTSVSTGSPAETAGVKAGDLITAVDGQSIDQDHTVPALISNHKPGDSVKLTVKRGDQQLDLTATLATRPDDASKGYLGIQIRPNGIQEFRGGIGPFPSTTGPLVVHWIEDGSPAKAAGLREGDEITAIDGQAVNSWDQFMQMIDGHKPGDTIKLTVKRGDQTLDLSVTLGGKPWLGAMIGPKIEFNMPNFSAEGAVIASVAAASPAESAGLKAGDVVREVDGQKIDLAHSLQAAIATHKPGDVVQLKIQRGDQEQTLSATLGARQDDSTKAYLGVQTHGFPFRGSGGLRISPDQPGASQGALPFEFGPGRPNFVFPAPQPEGPETGNQA